MKRRMWAQALLIAGKDLRVTLMDRSALAFMVALPLVFVAIFGTLMGGSPQDQIYSVCMVTQEGQGSTSQRIIDAVAAGDHKLGVRQMAADDARQAVLDGQLDGYLEFPAGFSAALAAGSSTELVIYANPEAQGARMALGSIGRAIAQETGSRWVRSQSTMQIAVAVAGPEIQSQVIALLASAEGAAAASPALDVEYLVTGPATVKPASTWLLPGYITMFVFFGLALTAEVLVGERENMTLDRLIASRATRGGILLGKYMGNVLRGTLQAGILWGVGTLLFKADLGYAPWATFLVTVAIVLCAAAMGLALAAIARTRAAASAMAVLGSMIMAPLGGCWWPLYIMPRWMQALARITPHAWANAAFNKLLFFAAPPAAVAVEVGVLLLFAAGFGAVAAARFRIE